MEALLTPEEVVKYSGMVLAELLGPNGRALVRKLELLEEGDSRIPVIPIDRVWEVELPEFAISKDQATSAAQQLIDLIRVTPVDGRGCFAVVTREEAYLGKVRVGSKEYDLRFCEKPIHAAQILLAQEKIPEGIISIAMEPTVIGKKIDQWDDPCNMVFVVKENMLDSYDQERVRGLSCLYQLFER